MANTTIGHCAQVIPKPNTVHTPSTPKGTYPYSLVALMLAAARHSETLGSMFDRLEDEPRSPAELGALLAGRYAMKYESYDFARAVRDTGLLLFAFDGTTVLQGGAA